MTAVVTRSEVAWAGARSGVAPAAWGQEYMWDVMGTLAPHTYILNRTGTVAVPAGRDLDDVLSALTTLVTRFDSLRTTFSATVEGDVLQHLTASGRLAVECWHAPAAEAGPAFAEHVRDQLAGTEFDLTAAPLFRVAVVAHEDGPVAVVWAASHVICDATSIRLVNRTLRASLSSAVPADEPPTQQPFDMAGFERSPAGQLMNAKAMRHWRDQLTAMPAGVLAARRRPPESPRFRRGALHSVAVRLAADALAVRLRMSSSAVLLAATAHALAATLGRSRVALQLTAGNRASPTTAGTVSNLAQTGLVVLDVDAGSFHATCRRAWPASMRAYEHARFRFRDLNALIDAVHRERREQLDLPVFFNDAREDVRVSPDARQVDAATIIAAAGESAFEWNEGIDKENIALLMLIRSAADGYMLSVLVDTAVFTLREAEHLVTTVERTLVDEACAMLQQLEPA